MNLGLSQNSMDTMLVRLCEQYGNLFAFRRKQSADAAHFSALERTDRRRGWAEYARFEYEKSDRFLARFHAPPRLQNMRVLDFGCRYGGAVARYAALGASHVIGLDVDADFFTPARELASELGLLDRVDFRVSTDRVLPVESGTIDIALTEDVMEHLSQPQAILKELLRVLRPGGKLYARFGPLWLHPQGVHMFDVFPGPWTHVLFPERVVCAVRARARQDGTVGRTYSDFQLNQMTARKFKNLVRSSGFEIEYMHVAGVYGADALAKLPMVGEFFASEVEAVLRRPR